jgi:hypothetical protein
MSENIFVSVWSKPSKYFGVLSGILNQTDDIILNSDLPELGSFLHLASPLR